MSKNTPTPYKVLVVRYGDGTDRILSVHVARGKLLVASMCDGPQNKIANAAFIVRACNNYEKSLRRSELTSFEGYENDHKRTK